MFKYFKPDEPTITLNGNVCTATCTRMLILASNSPKLERIPTSIISVINHLWYFHTTDYCEAKKTLKYMHGRTGKNFINDTEQKSDAKEYVLLFI